ncbi:hypothetical protein GCM10010430_59790 [Kitasatospora cystarginea]|uniref:Nudix hydrolase domain-containing protein n=1 Tax=Kitasatospora cystarginea TaxID=58350 RepID=A0ABP5RQM6_9ACTN
MTRPSGWLPPEQYVHTIANSTSYGCLYFTDTVGRPFQLRSSSTNTARVERWQWPGGNMDDGETPFACAVRECEEEIGIVFTGPPVLLGMQYIAPRGAVWPCSHIGFIFDGGVLTDDQLAQVRLSDEHDLWQVKMLEEWKQTMTPENFARLDTIEAARRAGTIAYMEV